MCCGCGTSYIVSVHIKCEVSIYTLVVSRTFIAGVASQTGDANSSWTPGITSGLQGSVNVHRGAVLLVPQWQCIISFVFYLYHMIHWALVEFLILQFTTIPLVYLQTEKDDKIPDVYEHRVKYEQFSNLIDKIHVFLISILPWLLCEICPVYHIW